MSLTFEPGLHVYRWKGQTVPSVTQALGIVSDLSFIDAARLEAAREFGSHVHLACDLLNRGELDEETLDANLLPYLGAYKKFLHESGFKVTHSEERVFHRQLHYAGTLDARGLWRKTTWLLDLKSGAVPASVGPQTAGYQQALAERPRKRMCLQLGRNRYRVFVQDDPADWSIFVSCLNVFKFINKRKFPHVDDYE